jgi:hypothetical protein
MMLQDLFKKIIFIFLIAFQIWIPAQNSSGIHLDIRNESRADKAGILDLIAVLSSEAATPFKGKIEIAVPQGFRNISGNTLQVDIQPGERLFLPVKIVVSSNAVSGDARLIFRLSDLQNKMAAEKEMLYTVAENNTIRIAAESPVIYVSKATDSVEVKARVSNLGNRKQNVTVVFKIPEADQGNAFIEKKGSIGVQKDSVFVFRFMPSRIKSRSTQLSVNIAGFREPDREIFGSTSVSVQNVSSVQRYEDLESTAFSNFTKNNITASYRHAGENLDMYQLAGSGGFNLPSGYVFIRGNIYTMTHQSNPIVNNTYLTYKRENNEFTIGNINKLLELSMFGRGLEYAYTSPDKNKKIEAGFVDQTYSLIERNSFLKYGYGFYTRGIIGAQNASRNMAGTYIFRNDPYEKARHHVAGTDLQYAFGKDWKTNTKVYGGLSFYENSQPAKPSLALESQYSGMIRKISLNGNYFYSTDYYPGNRRGILQIQQNFSTMIFKDHYVYANIMASHFSPKFYFYSNNLNSSNIRLDTGINFPKRGNIGMGLGYQYQEENSNSYNNFFNAQPYEETKQLKTQRLTEYLTWLSPDKQHSSILSMETGLVRYPDNDKLQYQMKVSGTYSYRWLTVNGIYQHGSYFLSEYAFSRLMNKSTPYEKLSLSAFVNKNFFDNQLNVTSGISYTNDVLYGKSPSGFMNLKYARERYALYLNSSYFSYSSGSFTNNLFTVEAGVTVNLRNSTLDPGKKGDIKAFVYYDLNENNIYDEGDKEAAGYLIMLNTISFKTDASGFISYRSIPYGKYALKQVIQQGWYYDETEFTVDKHHYTLEIPLHQNGTTQGKVTYDFDAKTAVDFTPKTGGILFNIYRNDQLVQRIITDDNGEFASFLPSGNYRIELNKNSLPSNTYCERSTDAFKVEAGKIVHVEPFVIKVREKVIRVKKFGG